MRYCCVKSTPCARFLDVNILHPPHTNVDNVVQNSVQAFGRFLPYNIHEIYMNIHECSSSVTVQKVLITSVQKV